jgi:hypothetical protein
MRSWLLLTACVACHSVPAGPIGGSYDMQFDVVGSNSCQGPSSFEQTIAVGGSAVTVSNSMLYEGTAFGTQTVPVTPGSDSLAFELGGDQSYMLTGDGNAISGSIQYAYHDDGYQIHCGATYAGTTTSHIATDAGTP